MGKEVLGDTLKLFYPAAHQQNGERYSKQALINIRSGLNRHLTLPPHNKPWNLMHDREFQHANKVFSGNLHIQKQLGLDVTRHKPPLPKDHMEKAFANYFEPHWDNDPKCLQLKVYFDLAYYMERRAKQGLRELQKDSFAIGKTPDGREYIELKYNEATKKSQGDDNNEICDNAILMEQPNSPRCPVKSFKLYLSKLTHLPDLFQQPNPKFRLVTDRWYKASPVGINQIGKFLSEISYFAGLEKRYTNHCMRNTTVNAMKKKNRSVPDMAFVLKHKSYQSLQSYINTPTLEEKQAISDELFDFTHTEEPSRDNAPPTPKKSKLSLSKKKETCRSFSKTSKFTKSRKQSTRTSTNTKINLKPAGGRKIKELKCQSKCKYKCCSCTIVTVVVR